MEQLFSLLANFSQALAMDATHLSDPEIQLRLVLQVFLLAASAFFSSSETSLFSLSQLDLQKLRRDHHPRANTLYQLLEQPRRLIISILCGNEIINVAASANMAAILIVLYGGGNAEWINILIMVPLFLLVGEVTPKTIAVSNPIAYSTRIVAVPLMVWVQLITPVRIAVRFVADRVSTWLVGEEKTAENLLHIDEFKTLVTEAEEEGGISTTERTLVYNLLSAGSTEIVEIMIPRTRTQFLNADWPLEQIIDRARQYRHNRLPVFRNSQDNIIGILHSEDLVPYARGDENIADLNLEKLLHPTIGAPPTKKVDEMFEFFQRNKAQAALVINEFGGVDGLITMKTVLDSIFGHLLGPVAGQHLYEERDENRYLVSGAMKLSDFNQLTHFGIDDPRMTTVGGVLFRHLDRLPQVGDSVLIDNISMRVVALEGHRITRIEVARGVQPDSILEAEER